MKKNLFYLLLPCLLLLGSVTTHASNLEMDDPFIGIIWASKSGDVACTFEVPEKYLAIEGLSATISISKKNGKSIYTATSSDFNFDLPKDLAGEYLITINIGAYVETQEVTL